MTYRQVSQNWADAQDQQNSPVHVKKEMITAHVGEFVPAGSVAGNVSYGSLRIWK
jgi:hypothetical protein